MASIQRKGSIMETPRLSLQPYKGTRDFYPDAMRLRTWFFGKIRKTLSCACFEEYCGADANVHV